MPDDTATADILMGDVVRLEDVLSRDSVISVCRSFFELFGLPVRVISHEGELLADVHKERSLCRYLNTLEGGKRACGETVRDVRNREPNGGATTHSCFTGAVYRIAPLEYQGRPVGRFIIGPYVPAETRSHPRSLVSVDPGTDSEKAIEQFGRMPRVAEDVAEQLSNHLKSVLELLLFSGHRAQLASSMQIANVRENYRELAQKNERLAAAYEELKQLDELKSNFLATVSHELRTPLTSIIGYTEMLESGAAGELAQEQNAFLQTIRSKADQLLRLISSLLDLGQLEQGGLQLHAEPLEARALLTDVASTIVPTANRKGISVDLEFDDELPRFVGDPVRVKQILINLADNAVKFTPEGGSVGLTARRAQLQEDAPEGLGAALFATRRPAVAFIVTDDGKGIPEDKLDRIFDAFYQIDNSSTREHGGAGLGLSIVRQLVAGHGGEIDVTSELGQGTVFVVKLPATADDG